MNFPLQVFTPADAVDFFLVLLNTQKKKINQQFKEEKQIQKFKHLNCLS